jgi:hypothetical protein
LGTLESKAGSQLKLLYEIKKSKMNVLGVKYVPKLRGGMRYYLSILTLIAFLEIKGGLMSIKLTDRIGIILLKMDHLR